MRNLLKFLFKEKYLALATIIILTPYNTVLCLVIESFIEESYGYNIPIGFLLSTLLPILLSALVIISITYILSIKEQVEDFAKFKDLSIQAGANPLSVNFLISSLFAIISILVILITGYIDKFSLYTPILPSLLFILSLLAVKYYKGALN